MRKKPLKRNTKDDNLEFRIAILEKNIQTMFDLMLRAGIINDKPRGVVPMLKEKPKPAKKPAVGRAKKSDKEEARRSVEFLIHSAIRLIPGKPL